MLLDLKLQLGKRFLKTQRSYSHECTDEYQVFQLDLPGEADTAAEDRTVTCRTNSITYVVV